MKTITRVILPVLALCVLLSGCGGAAPRSQQVSQSVGVSDILAAAEATPTPEPTAAPTAESAGTVAPRSADGELDVDLTALNSTMVYAEVYNMMSAPEDYVGKTVRMRGNLAVYEGTTRNYYACLIADAAACCAQGIEFLWAGEHAYPEDYPAIGAEITVTGVFDVYEEEGYSYVQLIDAQVEL